MASGVDGVHIASRSGEPQIIGVPLKFAVQVEVSQPKKKSSKFDPLTFLFVFFDVDKCCVYIYILYICSHLQLTDFSVRLSFWSPHQGVRPFIKQDSIRSWARRCEVAHRYSGYSATTTIKRIMLTSYSMITIYHNKENINVYCTIDFNYKFVMNVI